MASTTKLLLDALQSSQTPVATEDKLVIGGNALGKKAFVAFVNAQDVDGLSALHMACRNGHTKVASALLAAGADPRLCDNELNTAVSAAVCPKALQYNLLKVEPYLQCHELY